MIEVKRDPTIKLPHITTPIMNESKENDPKATDSETIRQQSKTEGIIAPIIRMNNMTILGSQVQYMRLTCNPLPEIYITINDAMNLIKTLDTPSNDNKIQIQILYLVDNAYKNINLVFYVTSCNISGSMISVHATYDAPKLYDSIMKSYGKISSYELFDAISAEYGLGFASNVSNTGDRRYIYTGNRSIIDVMNREIGYAAESASDANNQDVHVFEWWIDWWNYINFVDVYKEYKEILSDKDMQIWVTTNQVKSSSDETPVVEKTLAAFNNSPGTTTSQLHITNYTPCTDFPEVTDLNYEVYMMQDIEKISTIVMDGDIKNNIRMKYEYGGEVFGDYDYLTRKACRNILLSKINGQTIEVTTFSPIFGLPRGYKVNVYWWDYNNLIADGVQEVGNPSISSNIPLPEDIIMQDAKFIVNRTISGQYYIIDTELVYNMGRWEHKFKLGRSADQIHRLSEVAPKNIVE